MILARRQFLRTSLLFGASAVLLCGNTRLGFARNIVDGRELPDDVFGDPLYRFSRETFEPYVGGYFEAAGARDAMVALKLLKVDSYEPQSTTKISTSAGADTDSFSLLFKADGALPKFPTTYQIKHGALGDFSLFLTRRDGPSGEIFYEAVFNRVR